MRLLARPVSIRGDAWIPLAFILFFAVMLIANGTLIWFAFASWTGLATDGAYNRGLEYNRALEAERAQAAQGWRVDFDFAQTGERTGRLELWLEDRHRSLIEDATVTARLVRPTHSGADQTLPVPHDHGGRYVADLELPLPGQWEIRLKAVAPAGSYRLSERIFLAP